MRETCKPCALRNNLLKCLWAILLAIIIAFALPGCGNDNNSFNPAPDNSDKTDNNDKDEPDKKPGEGEETPPEPPIPDDTEPKEHMFSGFWHGWIINFDVYEEYSLTIDKDGNLTDESYYCRYDDINGAFQKFTSLEMQTADNSVTIKNSETEITFLYNEENDCLILNTNELNDLQTALLHNTDIIGLEDFYNSVSGIYEATDNEYTYSFRFDTEFGFGGELFCYSDDEENSYLEYFGVANGVIIISSILDDSFYFLTFNKEAKTLTFETSPTGNKNLVLTATSF